MGSGSGGKGAAGPGKQGSGEPPASGHEGTKEDKDAGSASPTSKPKAPRSSYTQAAALELVSPDVELGDVGLNTSGGPVSIRIKNPDPRGGIVHKVEISYAEIGGFTVSPSKAIPITVPAGATMEVAAVSFDPMLAGTFRATVRIETSGGTLTANVSARAVAPTAPPTSPLK